MCIEHEQHESYIFGMRCVLKENYRQFRRSANNIALNSPRVKGNAVFPRSVSLPVSLTIHKTPVKWINIVSLFPSTMESPRASAVAPP